MANDRFSAGWGGNILSELQTLVRIKTGTKSIALWRFHIDRSMASMAHPKSRQAKKPIVFINWDSENRDPSKNRTAINTHISMLASEKRRQAQAQRLRELDNPGVLSAVVPVGWEVVCD